MNDLLIILGRRVHELRAAKKWSQEEFAHISGLHRTYIGQIERGEKNISFDNLSRVAGALAVNLSELLEGLEADTTTNVKSPRALMGGPKETVHQQLATQRLVRRLKLQHAEMHRTILALESLSATDSRTSKPNRPRSSRRT